MVKKLFTPVRYSPALILFVATTLSGCGFLFGDDGLFPDRSNEYLQATEAKQLELPEHLPARQIADKYPVPTLKYAKVLPDKYEVPRVDSVDELESKGSVRIQRFAGDQWILIQRAPGQSWPLVLKYLESNQIPLLLVEAENGLLETDWLSVSPEAIELQQNRRSNNADKRPAKDLQTFVERYQFLFKQGVQKNTTEIWIKQKSAQREEKEATNVTAGDRTWSASSAPAREDNMLRLVAEFLAGSPDQSSYSLLAQGIGTASKVNLEYDDQGQPFIELKLPFDRGWGSLQLALEKASFEIDDRNRSSGIYYTRFVERSKKQKKPGFIKRIYRFFVRPASESNGERVKVVATKEGDALHITVSRIDEPVLKANEQAYMLRRILSKLS